MGFIAWILIGLIMGAIGRAVLPGRAEGGWVISLIVGIVGAIVGGWIANLVGGSTNNSFFNLSTWIFAFIGSLVVLVIWGAVSGNKK